MTLPYRYLATIRRREAPATLGSKGQRQKAPAATIAANVPIDLAADRQTIRLDDDGRYLEGTWTYFVAAGTDLKQDDYLEVTAGPNPRPVQLHVVAAGAEGEIGEGWDTHGTAELTSEVLD